MIENPMYIYLEQLRLSGMTNMFGAAPYLARKYGLDYEVAKKVLSDWMRTYNRKDYEHVTMEGFEV